jgi:MFS family permease
MVNKLSAYKIYLLFSAITAMCFSLTAKVMKVYHIEKVHLNPLQLIFVGTTLETACFIFAVTKKFNLRLIAYLATNTFRATNEPIFNAWLNGHIDNKARALSMNGQINSLGQILGGSIIGIIATNISVSVGIACTLLLVTPVLALYIISMIIDKKVADRIGGGDYEENN